MRQFYITLVGVGLLAFAPVNDVQAGMSLFQFSFENDGELTNAPFGTLKVVEGFNGVDTLTFTIDLDQTKLGANVDIHEFGFQLDLDYDNNGTDNVTGVVDLVPKPQFVGSGSNTFTLTTLGTMDPVAGFGRTAWDYMLNFGSGANPTLNPFTFTVGAPGLTLSALQFDDQPFKNNNPNKPTVSNFAVHAQSTSTSAGSEGLGGFYVGPTTSAVTPELGNTCGAIAALLAALLIPLRRALSTR